MHRPDVRRSEPVMSMSDQEAARLLWAHWQTGTTLDALPPRLRPADRDAGYAVQAQLPVVAGRSVVGWKIAATSGAGQAHIGVNGPLAGRLLSGQVAADGATISLAGNRMRVAEPEFAFRFGIDLAPSVVPYTVQQVLAAVDTLHPALEVPDSRFADFVDAGEAQLLADNACADRFVLGAPAAAGWREVDLRTLAVQARVFDADGCRTERAGDGGAVLGDPRIALAWLVNELSALGLTLTAGQFVTTGTCMAPLEIRPGDTVRANYGVVGHIAAHFAP
jgi:2-keto-4-pentenoate hydratase